MAGEIANVQDIRSLEIRKMEERVQQAIKVFHMQEQPNMRQLARDFDVSYWRLKARIRGRRPRHLAIPPWSRLSGAEEKALCHYLDRLNSMGLAVRYPLVLAAANSILRTNNPESPPQVDITWARRFIQRYKYHVLPQKVFDASRGAAEDADIVRSWFQSLESVITRNGIQREDIYNMDETGFQISMGKLVITRSPRTRYQAVPTNRETATCIEAVSATGAHIPAFLVLDAEVHMERCHRLEELHNDTVISVTSTGFSNDDTSFAWIKHFHESTKDRRVGSKRLLLLDGYGSHHTKEFVQFCDDHDIIPFGLPLHTTHLLQPLHVAVFQPRRFYYAKDLDIMFRPRCRHVTKTKFLSMIQETRLQALRPEVVRSAFEKTGIVPFNPDQVLDRVFKRDPRAVAMARAALAASGVKPKYWWMTDNI